MNILIEYPGVLPALKYGGTERAIWCLGKALHEFGHRITFLVWPGSSCPFGRVVTYQPGKSLNDLIPEDIEIAPCDDGYDGVIEQSMFMGAATHYWVGVAGKTLRVITTGGRAAILTAGQGVRLTPPPALHLLKTFQPTALA